MIRNASRVILPAALALVALGCDDGSQATTDMGGDMGGDMNVSMDGGGTDGGGMDGGGTDGGAPARPQLGSQIDRMGRPAINTALTDPFNFDTMHDQTQDAYNKNGDPTTWATQYATKMAHNLAIFDVLDGSCGNQLLYNATAGGAGFSAAGYTTLATVLSDDELYVNTGSGTCTSYLAVEAAFVTAMQPMDCGGRAPTYDVIDVSYTLLSGAGMTVGDGVAADPDNAANNMTFPFLGAPNQ